MAISQALILLMFMFMRSSVRLISPESDGLAKVRSFVEVLNSRDHSRMEKYIAATFLKKSSTPEDLSARADRILSLSSLGPPFRITHVLIDTPERVIVQVDGATETDLEIKMTFDTGEGHLATSVYMGGPGSQTTPPPKTYDTWKDLSDLLNQVRSDTNVPALGAAFFNNGTEQEAVVGNREVKKPDLAEIGDRWLIGSIAKSMTATMIARIVDQGLLRWDETIQEALPNTPMRAEYRQVTLLQLLRHRSGLPQDLFVNPTFLEKAAGSERDPVKAREHYVQFILGREPIAKPDVRMLYSNAGYAVAAHIAEVVTHKPYAALMSELVFGPLNMRSAQFGVPGSRGNPGAKGQLMGHSPRGKDIEPNVVDEPKWVLIQSPAGAGLSMSLADLLRFLEYHLKGMRGQVSLMRPENFAMLHRMPEFPGADRYACGWIVSEGITREPFQGHNGSDGTFRADMAVWPDRNLAIVSISNVGSLAATPPSIQAIVAIYNRYAK